MDLNDLQGIAAEWWSRILAGFHRDAGLEPTLLELGLILAVALAVSVPRASWRYFGLFVTMVHELGHAFAALTTGRLVKGIHLRFDQSGAMMSRGSGRAGAVWAGFWGYPVPAVVGCVLVLAAFSGWSSLALSVSALLLLATLLFIRNAQGAVIAVGLALASSLLVWFAPAALLGHLTLALGIGLLVGSVRDWLNLLGVHTRRRHQLANSDAHILSRRTGVPSALWLAGFAAVIMACWVLAGMAVAAVAGFPA
ncbi:M50 family metallopeptidase [Arthrobacter sp. USHLN218]|uniref:M50 family metallopeptidase n=1 Tax=Arthrobacter sp. USHLN218 TaxID=3081232 RepID=UPI003019DF7B